MKNSSKQVVKSKVDVTPTERAETANNTITSIQEKRAYLKALSKVAALYVEQGDFETVNEAIIQTVYKSSEHKIFKTFKQWKADGYSVNKGEKAFVVWGRPAKFTESENGTDQQVEEKFFPLAFLFSNAQVKKRA